MVDADDPCPVARSAFGSRFVGIGLMLASLMLSGCGAGEQSSVDARVDGRADAISTSDGSGAMDGAADTPDTGPSEACNGLDDDEDGDVDEGCECVPGATQNCYPTRSGPPEGCARGTQQCGSDQRWASCTGAIRPLAGATACCTDPQCASLGRFMSAYPLSAIPSHSHMLSSFMPALMDSRLVNARVVVGNEIVDCTRGGVTMANLLEGRRLTRMAAMMRLGITDRDVIRSCEPAPIQMGSGCGGGMGAAWGSLLYRHSDGSVREVVFLYVGINNSTGDAEGYYASETPTNVCPAGSVPG